MITRENRWRGGKGYKKYVYTIKDVAKLKGIKPASVRNDMCNGKVEMDKLDSVLKYILVRL